MILSKSKRKYMKKGNLITHAYPDSIIADQFRTIRSNMKFLTNNPNHRIFLFTSVGSGEGTSTAISNLAVTMAKQNEKVLLIDANLRSPVVQSVFKKEKSLGLTNLLTKDLTWSSVINQTGIGELDILTSGSSIFNPAEIVESAKMQELLKEFKTIYDVILIDSPTILKYTETRLLANYSDGVVLLVGRGKTDLEDVIEAKRVLELAKANVMGVIINEKYK
ncbi:polysaccharide biosynthesis tyrosine autokinase [Agaribacter marinus]|uniref:non-specific protein-tyrosine kinase n=2 Tax=Virgibacillus salarius TaxID=447199 RepID=A0A941DWY8_9BACI|nr:CpsD/CapB family tyrosine-protein kinase [Virgibacillus salarius]NAZ09359.1 polysaccharide biosynthesis tyrosine autokinase [Agaribacter marinus]